MNGEYRKIEEELRKFCKGNIMVIPGEEEKYLRRGRIKTLRVKKKKEPGTREQMGGISRIRKAVRIILGKE